MEFGSDWQGTLLVYSTGKGCDVLRVVFYVIYYNICANALCRSSVYFFTDLEIGSCQKTTNTRINELFIVFVTFVLARGITSIDEQRLL